MKRATFLLFGVALALPAAAQINANGFINFTPNGGAFDYNITLNNTGTTTIGTLWYSWVPGIDFLSVQPTAISAPTGWNVSIQGGGLNNGFSVQYVASSSANFLQSGQSMSGFRFTSTETPTELASNSPIVPHDPTGTSFVYEGAPFVGQSLQFVINPVPEPASLLVLGPALLLMRRRKRA